jgi:hypothetical protein
MVVMKKGGMSEIVATVLIVLITVVAVGVVWGLVIPMFQDSGWSAGYEADIVIETDGGYTYFDSTKGVACVQVSRTNSDLNLTRIDVLFTYGGTTLDDKGNFSGDELPEGNEMKQKCFNLSTVSSLGTNNYLAPDSIKLVPIYFDGTKEVVGDVVAVVTGGSGRGSYGRGSYGGGSLPDFGGGNGGVVEVSSCDGSGVAEITEANVRYELNQSVTAVAGTSCFVIDVPNITLDLKGFSIIGNGGRGIFIDGQDDVVITSTGSRGEISGFDRGIFVQDGQDCVIENIKVEDSVDYGIVIEKGSGNKLIGIVVEDDINNGKGIFLDTTSNNVLRDILISDYDESGLELSDSWSNVFEDISLSMVRSLDGSISLDSSDTNNFSGILVEYGYLGISITSSGGNEFVDVSFSGVTQGGIDVSGGSVDNVFDDITILNEPTQAVGISFREFSNNNELKNSFVCSSQDILQPPRERDVECSVDSNANIFDSNVCSMIDCGGGICEASCP